jgi:hypothetical protein
MADTLRITFASDFSPGSRAAFSMALRLTKAGWAVTSPSCT